MRLRDLQKKPRATKERYAFLGAATVTAVIAMFWLVAVSVQLTTPSDALTDEESSASGAFAQFWADAKESAATVIGSAPVVSTTTEAFNLDLATTTEAEPEEPAKPARPVLIETINTASSATATSS